MNMKFRYTHYRVPFVPVRDYPKRGSPKRHDTQQYSRNCGWIDVMKDTGIKPYERGGMTVCEIVDKDDNVLAKGSAVCSYADNFNYRLGRIIAVGRAVDQMNQRYREEEWTGF